MKLLQGRRAVRRSFAAAGVLMLLFTARPAPAPLSVPSASGETPVATKGETRLRKLHLVRPDLIPYPIAFEVYC